MMKELRDFFVALATEALEGTTATVTTAGDTTVKDPGETRVRVKLYPRETIQTDITGDLVEVAGTVQFDVFSPKIEGKDAAEDIAQLIVDAGRALIGPNDQTTYTVYIQRAWREAMREETSLHIPVVIRWLIQY